MKQVLIVLILLISFRSAAQPDSTHLKRTELWNQLQAVFSKDWELRSIDQSEKTNWDTVYALPTALFRVELVWKKLPDFANLYFFEKKEKDSSHIKIIQQVLDKYITT